MNPLTQQQWTQVAQQLHLIGFSPQDIMNFLGPPPQNQGGLGGLGLAGLAATAGGGISEMMADKPAYSGQMQAMNMGMHPAQIASQANQITKQLNPQLVNNVLGPVMAKLGASGLATSPGMSTQIMGQALAPYAQQNQQTALSTVMGGLEMPFKVGSGLGGNYTQLMSQLPFGINQMALNQQAANNPYGGYGYGAPYGYGGGGYGYGPGSAFTPGAGGTSPYP